MNLTSQPPPNDVLNLPLRQFDLGRSWKKLPLRKIRTLVTHAYTRASYTQISRFFLHFLHLLGHPLKITPISEWLRKTKTFTHKFLSNKRIAYSVKEVKDKNTFCKGCARVRARGFPPLISFVARRFFPQKGLPKFSVRIVELLKNIYQTAIVIFHQLPIQLHLKKSAST